MINIPTSLQSDLEAGVTTLCWCWRVTRSDGEIFGFTEHDKDLEIDGVTYRAGTGWTAGAQRSETGLSAARTSSFGGLDSQVITASDIDNGLWDYSRVEILRVNWSDPTQYWLAVTGEITDIKRSEVGFEAEISGLSARLNRKIGRVFSRTCDAELGDARCGVDLENADYIRSVTIADTQGSDEWGVTGAEDRDAGWFRHGVARFDTGPNAGAQLRITDHTIVQGETRIRVERPPSVAVSVADTLTLQAGCDKTDATCRLKFSNLINFQGFPHMPGNDLLLRHASREVRRDGSAR